MALQTVKQITELNNPKYVAPVTVMFQFRSSMFTQELDFTKSVITNKYTSYVMIGC